MKDDGGWWCIGEGLGYLRPVVSVWGRWGAIAGVWACYSAAPMGNA
jgi:hypothetical protein